MASKLAGVGKMVAGTAGAASVFAGAVLVDRRLPWGGVINHALGDTLEGAVDASLDYAKDGFHDLMGKSQQGEEND